MNLHLIDISIIGVYLFVTLFIGIYISKKASSNMNSYFLAGNDVPWYYLGLSNASGMFDISGTTWMVMLMFIYGLKSVFIPWLWPVFNQIFMMIFLSIWLRRSGVMTGAEWIRFRFGSGRGAELSHLIVVVFAIAVVITYVAYGFMGMGKFAAVLLPWELSADASSNELYYGLLICLITTLYVVKGGMYSVIFTEVIQYGIMTFASISIGIIAMQRVSPEMLRKVVPEHWDELSFGYRLDLDWSELLPAAQLQMAKDGWELFYYFMMMVLLKGIIQSVAGPAPNYDMQRILSARTPREAAKMSGFVNLVLIFPRYMLITGLAILALVFFSDDLRLMGENADFELILPSAINNFVPIGLLGILIAGLLAAFMSSFAASVNTAPAYIVNDIIKKYFVTSAPDKTYVYYSYLASLGVVLAGLIFGLYLESLTELIDWLVSALYGGYAAANVLKWYWWRFNGYGYFWGMMGGIAAALVLPFLLPEFSALEAFPFNFTISLTGCLLGSYLTPQDDMGVLKSFYYKTRPWGLWGPVIAELRKDHIDLEINNNFRHDALNVLIGIVWQTALTCLPIFLVIKNFQNMAISILIICITSYILKTNWYDKIEDYPSDSIQSKIIVADQIE